MTKKQRELLNFISAFIKTNGYAPSYREVMKSLHYRSVSTVATHVENLISLGYLEKKDRSARSLRVAGKDIEFTEARVSAAKQKWLVDLIDEKFTTLEASEDASQKEIDDLFVLVGALHVLGFKDAATSFRPRLLEFKQLNKIDSLQ
jgi:SOS-response transcriptional repressor LexA